LKTVVVTGGTRGLGEAIVGASVAAGYKVIAVGRRPGDGLNRLMREHGDRVSFEAFDLSDVGAIHEFATTLVKAHGRPWALVNNAAIGQSGILATLHESDVSTLLRVNLEAPILLTKYLLRPMLLNRAGRVVNITSIIATTGFKGLTVYGATKAGLGSFTRSLAREVGAAGLTVNNVAPGYMDTDMTVGLQGEKLDSIRRRSAMGRLAVPSDVAHAVMYLLSDAAASVTGTTLTVDAGSTA
jgi:3-oxoacyl-[acyl-carrier protein] reductase